MGAEGRVCDPIVVSASETRAAGDYSSTRTAEVRMSSIAASDLLGVIEAVSCAARQDEGAAPAGRDGGRRALAALAGRPWPPKEG